MGNCCIHPCLTWFQQWKQNRVIRQIHRTTNTLVYQLIFDSTRDLLVRCNFGSVYQGVIKPYTGTQCVGNLFMMDRPGLNLLTDTYEVAVKETTSTSMFNHEVETLQRLHETHYIIPLIAALPQRQWILLKHCTQGDLFEWLTAHHPLSHTTIAQILHQLVLGIRECHARHIAHLDLKLENIGLCMKDETDPIRIYLLDFAGAQLIDQEEVHYRHQFNMTLHYLPPEIMTREVFIGSELYAMDYWQIGVIAYTLLTGEYPFESHTESKVRRKIRCAQIPPLPDKDQVFEPWIRGLLQKNPIERFQLDTEPLPEWMEENFFTR
jgi:serine/threonine protein kinase